MAAHEDEIERGAMRDGISQLTTRLSPEVTEIIRLDLIQKVGNALRYRQRTEQEKLDLEAFADQEVSKGAVWATW